jgi:7,8-dihydropterin-6-yl-methyl-4-(beta-D-ribofuranosyl)aminobenzene 5'-phosphate synthase
MSRYLVFVSILLTLSLTQTSLSAVEVSHHAAKVRVTILSSNLANGNTVGEWGFSALVQVDGRCILFDTGRFPDTVLRNATALNVDLSCVSDVVLSHFHFDHTTGLPSLVHRLRKLNPDAIKRVHVAEGMFLSRRMGKTANGPEVNNMINMRKELTQSGVQFLEYSKATEIVPAVWVTGPVPRTHSEKTYPLSLDVNQNGKWVTDYVPESQGLVVVTEQGPIVLLGCGHSGSINLLEHVQNSIQNHSIHALMGGMHLFAADDETLDWTGDKLRKIGLQHLMAGHCTGIEPMFRLRASLNLNRRTAVIGAVGSAFLYGEGIRPTAIAQ